jgi:signal transduction histidine kinase
MKRRIIIGLSAYALLFLVVGLYIVYTIQTGTTRLNDLIRLHQVEILREHFLIQIKKVQTDLALRNSRFSRSFDTVALDVWNMETVIDNCFICHHAPPVQAQINALRDSTQQYLDDLSHVLTNRNNTVRLASDEAGAFRHGEVLIEQVHDMVALTNARLNGKTEQVLREIARSRTVLYVLLAMGPLFSLALAVAFIRGVTAPVSRLLEATRSLKRGELDHRVEGMREEFGELASSFNDMAGSINDQMRQMREAEQRLEDANRNLKIAQQQMVRSETMAALGTLSSGISHELSTPLSVILNMTQLVKQDVSDNPALLKDLEVLEYEANQAIKVTRSLLGFARSARSRKEEIDVNGVLEDLFKILEFQPSAKAVRVHKSLDPGVGLIHADSGRVRQVFLNIILNALQAMPDGGKLEVFTRKAGTEAVDGVEVEIRDTGAGIPRGDLEKIFQPFFTTKEDGTGLGLAITFGIVQEHNGRIEVESEVGRGTTFRVFLPDGGVRAEAK